MSKNNNQSAAAKAPKAAKAPAVKPLEKRVITQEDLDNNPDLVEQGFNVGDEIEIPKEVKPAAAKAPKAGRSDGKMIGNKDPEGEYPFDERWRKAVVVRQSNIRNVGEGGVKDYIEVPSSIRLAPYEPAMFARLEKDKSFGSDKVKIIHDPR